MLETTIPMRDCSSLGQGGRMEIWGGVGYNLQISVH